MELSLPGRDKLVVAIDVDEVLCDFLGAICDYHNATDGPNGGMILAPKDFHVYRYWEIWGGTQEECSEKVHRFFDTPYFGAIKPINGALEVLKKYSSIFDFQCVTSRQFVIEQATRDWVEKYYPGIFSEIHFGNHYSKESPDIHTEHPTKRSKPEMCENINAIALIDDSLEYARGCTQDERLKERNFKVALFGAYPWNKTTSDADMPLNTRRYVSWKEAEKFLADLAIEHGLVVPKAQSRCLCFGV